MEHAKNHSRQMSARMASSHLMTQNAEAASSQQLAAVAAAVHRAEKLDLKLADVQWELEQCQQQLKDKTAQTELQLKVWSCCEQAMQTLHMMQSRPPFHFLLRLHCPVWVN